MNKLKDLFTKPYYTAFEWFIVVGILAWLLIAGETNFWMAGLSYFAIISIIIRSSQKLN